MIDRAKIGLGFLLITILLLFAAQPTVYSSSNSSISVILNGKKITFSNAQPEIMNGSVFVPFRAIFEAMRLTVSLNTQDKSVTGKNDTVEIRLYIGSKVAYVNQKKYELPSPVFVKGGATYIPMRFVGEATGANVSWNNSARVASIEYAAINPVLD
jgi:hypothetical protein